MPPNIPIINIIDRIRLLDSVGNNSLAVKLAEDAAGDEMKNNMTMKTCRTVRLFCRFCKMISMMPAIPTKVMRLLTCCETHDSASNFIEERPNGNRAQKTDYRQLYHVLAH